MRDVRAGEEVDMNGVFVIAEAGVNHNGSVELAKKLIDVAVAAQANAVKFQTFRAERVVSPLAAKAVYQKRATCDEESQYEMLRMLELDRQAHLELFKYGSERGIIVLSTPFDIGSVDLLESLGVPLFKIGSGEITNIPFLRYVANKQKPIILSTGMSTIDEVSKAVDEIYAVGNREITLLHCVSSYPVPLKEANVKAMVTMREHFNVNVGYSDHTLGFEASLAAVALGACVIERHFTIDKTLEGPDHQASLDPRELMTFVEHVRRVELALGDGIKKPMPCETDNLPIVRRSLFVAFDVSVGTVIKENMLVSMRPATGVSPADYPRIVGMRAKRNIKSGEIFQWDMLEE